MTQRDFDILLMSRLKLIETGIYFYSIETLADLWSSQQSCLPAWFRITLFTRLISIESQPKKIVVVAMVVAVFVVIGLVVFGVVVVIVGHLTLRFGQNKVNNKSYMYCRCCCHCFSFIVVVDPET